MKPPRAGQTFISEGEMHVVLRVAHSPDTEYGAAWFITAADESLRVKHFLFLPNGLTPAMFQEGE